MPRYIVTPHARSPKHDRYVKKLAQEFTASSPNLQPMILEEQVPSTKSRHVRVIWDAWKDLTDEQRSDVIIDAYSQAEGPKAAAEITLAEGVTPQEALALGMLSFKVVPTHRRTDAVPMADYEAALADEARNTLLGAKAKELRFARVEDAEQARQRLQQALPGSSWATVQETAIES
jgi:hypothetical protein